VTPQELKLHIAREHREKQLVCDCGEKFGPLFDLKQHIKATGKLNVETYLLTGGCWFTSLLFLMVKFLIDPRGALIQGCAFMMGNIWWHHIY